MSKGDGRSRVKYPAAPLLLALVVLRANNKTVAVGSACVLLYRGVCQCCGTWQARFPLHLTQHTHTFLQMTQRCTSTQHNC